MLGTEPRGRGKSYTKMPAVFFHCHNQTPDSKEGMVNFGLQFPGDTIHHGGKEMPPGPGSQLLLLLSSGNS